MLPQIHSSNFWKYVACGLGSLWQECLRFLRDAIPNDTTTQSLIVSYFERSTELALKGRQMLVPHQGDQRHEPY